MTRSLMRRSSTLVSPEGVQIRVPFKKQAAAGGAIVSPLKAVPSVSQTVRILMAYEVFMRRFLAVVAKTTQASFAAKIRASNGG
jgi:hypothetical protein